MLALAGVLRPSAGKVLLGEQDLTGRRPERIRTAGVAVVPEGRRLLPELTVEDNLRVATFALPRRRRPQRRSRDAFELFPSLEKRRGAQGRSLSGGEQQMLVLAQALVSRPKILVVDELSLGLAPIVVKGLVPTLEKVAASGVGVLLIEQFAHVALGARDDGLRPRGRPHPLPRDGPGAEEPSRHPPLGVSRGRRAVNGAAGTARRCALSVD